MRNVCAAIVVSACLMPAMAARPTGAVIALENTRVRAYRTSAGALAGVAHGPGVVIWLGDTRQDKAGRAIWRDDAASAARDDAGTGEIVIVQPLASAALSSAPPTGTPPGGAPFVGMSFVRVFDNDRVTVTRARMDVGAREEYHTHAADTVVVHLSGGEIEDTADGKTVVNRWKRGDVEFEARGSSHSARNVSHAVDVVLVGLKP